MRNPTSPKKSRKTAYLTSENRASKVEEWLAALEGMKGRKPLPSLDRSALVLVDLQRIFCSAESPAYLPAFEGIRESLHELICGFRDAGRPVLATRHVHPEGESGSLIGYFFGRLLTDDDPLSRILPEFSSESIPVFDKSSHACFASALPEVLAPCETIVLAGVQTPLCVLSTALDLARVKKIPVVVADATASPDEAGHMAALNVLAHGHAHVASIEEIAAVLHGGVDG